MTKQVQVPVSLLLSAVPVTTKLVAMATRLRPAGQAPTTAWLCSHTGLSRPTVLKGLAQLPSPGGPTVPVPEALITNHELGATARVLFATLLLTPGYAHPFGLFTWFQLAELARISRGTAYTAVDELVGAEWVKVEQTHRKAPVHFELTYPGRERSLSLRAAVEWRLEQFGRTGENIMREFLTALVDSDEWEDDAAPGFLVNPLTLGRLELDRYYPPAVAFEHNGPQHYRQTKRFTAEQSRQQRVRDYIKMGICADRGITLVIVHPEDLTLDTMRQKVGNLLPLRDLAGYDLVIDLLEYEGREYQKKMARI